MWTSVQFVTQDFGSSGERRNRYFDQTVAQSPRQPIRQ
jgi:hypothetical protein